MTPSSLSPGAGGPGIRNLGSGPSAERRSFLSAAPDPGDVTASDKKPAERATFIFMIHQDGVIVGEMASQRWCSARPTVRRPATALLKG